MVDKSRWSGLTRVRTNRIYNAPGHVPSVAALTDASLLPRPACIDQDNVDANLASLPVFLAGCRSLVVLAGQTYCERLWCVVELFTFLRMGGSPDNIVVYRLGGSDKIREALAKFDGLKAKCYFPRDREKLLAVVEAGYGDMEPFNKQVRHILDKNSEGGQATFQDDDEASGGSGVQPSGGGAPPHGIPERVRV